MQEGGATKPVGCVTAQVAMGKSTDKREVPAAVVAG